VTPNLTTPTDAPPKVSDASKRRDSSWDIRNAPRNYISLVLFQVGSALFSFGAVWLITRHLGSEGYGGIIAIIAASQVAQILVNWTSVAVVRFGVDEFIETEKIAKSFWLIFLVLVANLTIVAGLSSFWFPPLADWLKLRPESFWLVMTHFTVTALWIHVQMSLQGAKKPRVQGFLQMIERLFIFTGLFALTAAAWLTPSWAMICYIAAPAAAMIFGIFQLRKYIWSRFSVDRAFVKKFFTYSLPLLPFSLVGYFSGSYVDAIFLSKFLSTSDLGVYSVATQINGIALQLPTLANTLLLPLFVTLQRETENQRSFNYFRNVLPTLTLLWGLACTALAFVAYYAIPLAFGAEFREATVPLWILLASATIGIPIVIGYSALSNATSTTYISMIAAVLSSITNIAANFTLIPRYGLAGCAIATAIAYSAGVTTFAILVNRDTKMPLSWVYAAILPCIAGTISFYVMQNAWLGLLVCVGTSFLIGYLYKDSLNKTFLFLKNFRTT
jgi:O-antigen/teichoic acid export membrane protein